MTKKKTHLRFDEIKSSLSRAYAKAAAIKKYEAQFEERESNSRELWRLTHDCLGRMSLTGYRNLINDQDAQVSPIEMFHSLFELWPVAIKLAGMINSEVKNEWVINSIHEEQKKHELGDAGYFSCDFILASIDGAAQDAAANLIAVHDHCFHDEIPDPKQEGNWPIYRSVVAHMEGVACWLYKSATQTITLAAALDALFDECERGLSSNEWEDCYYHDCRRKEIGDAGNARVMEVGKLRERGLDEFLIGSWDTGMQSIIVEILNLPLCISSDAGNASSVQACGALRLRADGLLQELTKLHESPSATSQLNMKNKRRGQSREESYRRIEEYLKQNGKHNEKCKTKNIIAATGVSAGMLSKCPAWQTYQANKPGARKAVPLMDVHIEMDGEAKWKELEREQKKDNRESTRRPPRCS